MKTHSDQVIQTILPYLNLEASEGQICIGMHAKYTRAFLAWKLLYGFPKDLHLRSLRHTVALLGPVVLVEFIAWS